MDYCSLPEVRSSAHARISKLSARGSEFRLQAVRRQPARPPKGGTPNAPPTSGFRSPLPEARSSAFRRSADSMRVRLKAELRTLRLHPDFVPLEAIQESAAAVLEEVEHSVEALAPSVVGIGDLFLVVLLAQFAEE